MELKKRIDNLERRAGLSPEVPVRFEICVPPETVKTREEWQQWYDERERTSEGIVTTFTIDLAHGGELDDEA